MWCNVGVAVDINLYCATTNINTRDFTTKEMKYEELRPSHFTVTIEITSPGKVLTRLPKLKEVPKQVICGVHISEL